METTIDRDSESTSVGKWVKTHKLETGLLFLFLIVVFSALIVLGNLLDSIGWGVNDIIIRMQGQQPPAAAAPNSFNAGGPTATQPAGLVLYTNTPKAPAAATATLQPKNSFKALCPGWTEAQKDKQAIMRQWYPEEGKSGAWHVSTVDWTPNAKLGIEYPSKLVEMFGIKSEANMASEYKKAGLNTDRNPEKEQKLDAYVVELVKLGKDLDPKKNWVAALKAYLDAYIGDGSTCFSFPDDQYAASFGTTSNYGLPETAPSAAGTLAPQPGPFGPALSGTAPSAAGTLAPSAPDPKMAEAQAFKAIEAACTEAYAPTLCVQNSKREWARVKDLNKIQEIILHHMEDGRQPTEAPNVQPTVYAATIAAVTDQYYSVSWNDLVWNQGQAQQIRQHTNRLDCNWLNSVCVSQSQLGSYNVVVSFTSQPSFQNIDGMGSEWDGGGIVFGAAPQDFGYQDAFGRQAKAVIVGTVTLWHVYVAPPPPTPLPNVPTLAPSQPTPTPAPICAHFSWDQVTDPSQYGLMSPLFEIAAESPSIVYNGRFWQTQQGQCVIIDNVPYSVGGKSWTWQNGGRISFFAPASGQDYEMELSGVYPLTLYLYPVQ